VQALDVVVGKMHKRMERVVIHKIASRASGEAIHFRDVKIGVKKIEWMSVKNLTNLLFPLP